MDLKSRAVEKYARTYLLCTALYFIGVAFNNILIPWIVTHELRLDARHLGFAQAALILPMACLVLIGGRLADALERRALLTWSFAAMALVPLGLGLMALFADIGFGTLIIGLAAMGVVGSVLNPTRDAMLSRVSGGDVQPLVAKTAAVQYAVQIVGYALAASLGLVATGVIFLAQSLTWFLGALAALRLPRDLPIETSGSHEADRSKGALASRPGIRPVLILAAVLGASGMGTILVLVPLLVLAPDARSAALLTVANVCFTIGTIVTSGFILRRGGFREKQGRHVVLAGLLLSVNIACLAFAPSRAVLFALLLIMGGLTATLAILLRGIVQSLADPARRGRTLGLYNLGFLGGGPLGAACLGVIAADTSVQTAGLAAAGLLFAALAALALLTRLPSLSLARI